MKLDPVSLFDPVAHGCAARYFQGVVTRCGGFVDRTGIPGARHEFFGEIDDPAVFPKKEDVEGDKGIFHPKGRVLLSPEQKKHTLVISEVGAEHHAFLPLFGSGRTLEPDFHGAGLSRWKDGSRLRTPATRGPRNLCQTQKNARKSGCSEEASEL